MPLESDPATQYVTPQVTNYAGRPAAGSTGREKQKRGRLTNQQVNEIVGRYLASERVGMIMPRQPSIIELDMSELEDVPRRAEAKLDEKDYALLKALAESYAYLSDLAGNKNASISRLRKLLFGSKTEKTAAVVGGSEKPEVPPSGDSGAEPSDERGAEAGAENNSANRPPAHGRNGADAYVGAEKIAVAHELLRSGDACPKCQRGTVYETGRPGVLVRLVGQAPLAAQVYELQKLCCSLCGKVFTARPPEGVGEEKYDATAGSMIALLKYGSGMPFNRTERLEGSVGIPLPASTQWDIVHAQARRVEPVFEELLRQAAQGKVLFNDHTTVKILEMIQSRARQEALAQGTGDTPPGQQRVRAGVEEGNSPPRERPVLQNGEWRPRRRPVHEPDPHLRVVRDERLRLPERVGAARDLCGRASRGIGCRGTTGRHWRG